jgi:hypothetical protein
MQFCHSKCFFTPYKAGFDNVLPALSSVRQMLWDIEGFIISSQDWGKRIIVVKLCMAFESGPDWLEELFSAEYYLALIQCNPTGIYFLLLLTLLHNSNLNLATTVFHEYNG